MPLSLSADTPITDLAADCLGYRHLTSLRKFCALYELQKVSRN